MPASAGNGSSTNVRPPSVVPKSFQSDVGITMDPGRVGSAAGWPWKVTVRPLGMGNQVTPESVLRQMPARPATMTG